MAVCDTPTTQTIGMTVLFAKRVSLHLLPMFVGAKDGGAVWVGPLVVKELKRIVEASEITKCVPQS